MEYISTWAKVLKAKPNQKQITYRNLNTTDCNPYIKEQAREDGDLLKYEFEFHCLKGELSEKWAILAD